MRLSIRSLILGGLVAAQLASYAVLIVTVRTAAEDAAQEQARATLDGLSDLLARETAHFLDHVERATTLTQRLASSEFLRVGDVEQIERYLFEIIKTGEEIDGAYFATPAGEFIVVSREAAGAPAGRYLFRRILIEGEAPREHVLLRDEAYRPVGNAGAEAVAKGFDPRSRPWFRDALGAEGVFWTDPYILPSSRRPGVSTAQTVRNEAREIVGVVGTDVTLHRLSNALEGLRLGDDGIGFMMTGSGEVFAHSSVAIEPDGEDLRLPSLARLGGALPAAAEAIERPGGFGLGAHEFLQFSHAEQSYLGLLFPVSSHGQAWFAGLLVPEAFFPGWFSGLELWLGLAALAMALAWSAAGYLAWRVIDRRLALIRGHAGRVLEGNLEPVRVPATGLAELRETELAIAKMVRALDKREREKSALTQRLRLFFEGVEQNPVAVLITDPEGRIEYVNPAFSALTGFAASRAVGDTPMLLVGDSDDRSACHAVVATLRDGRVWKGDLGLTTAEGEHLEIGVVAAPIKASDGRTLCCCAILHDKTIEKESQANDQGGAGGIGPRQPGQDRLPGRHQPRAADAPERHHRLQRDHGGRDLRADRQRSLPGSTARPSWKAAGDLLGIISGILDLAAAQSNRLLLIEDEVPLSEPLCEAIRMCHGVAERQSVEIRQVGAELPVMRLDSLKCRQIFVNLIDNAVKSSPKGAAVTVAAERRDDARIVVDITDRGPGMSPAEARAVMQPFERLVRSTRISDEGGLGLGLPTAQAFARLHDAELQIFSEVGRGTTVRVTFPAERLVA